MSALEVVCWVCGAFQFLSAVCIIVNWLKLPRDEAARDSMFLLVTMLSGALVMLAMCRLMGSA